MVLECDCVVNCVLFLFHSFWTRIFRMALRKVTQSVLRNQTRAASQSTVSPYFYDLEEKKKKRKSVKTNLNLDLCIL